MSIWGVKCGNWGGNLRSTTQPRADTSKSEKSLGDKLSAKIMITMAETPNLWYIAVHKYRTKPLGYAVCTAALDLATLLEVISQIANPAPRCLLTLYHAGNGVVAHLLLPHQLHSMSSMIRLSPCCSVCFVCVKAIMVPYHSVAAKKEMQIVQITYHTLRTKSRIPYNTKPECQLFATPVQSNSRSPLKHIHL